ncbi:phosphoglycerate mutase family protein [Lentibacillus sp. N15]|uniref:histidine phosphatase family protein n=1 Tax=Lentibacillus songyuanensis TaxID=3136161 RepID=UPI0031BB084D
MELIFVRHGQGQHTLNPPDSLYMENPSLTEAGREQALLLRHNLPLDNGDIVIISPTRRTLETAYYWAGDSNADLIVTPVVSPRMFPQKAGKITLPCDEIIRKEKVKCVLPTCSIDQHSSDNLWNNGINTMADQEFRILGGKFLRWCKQQSKEKIYIVSHDGTITSYRQLVSTRLFSRKDFLEDAAWVSERY